MIFFMLFNVILLHMLMTPLSFFLYCKLIGIMACGSSLIWLLNLNLNFEALYTGFNFKGGKTQSAVFGRPNNSCAINVSLIKDYPLRCKDFHSFGFGLLYSLC